MISMMLFYSCTCTMNRTGENKVQWNQHNTHMQTQKGTFHDCLYYRPSEKMPQTLFY